MTAPPSPAPVWDVVNGFAAYWTVHAAVELGVFDVLADAPRTAAELADAVDVAEGDVALLAELLVALDLLDTENGSFRANPVARRYLTSSSPATMTGLVHAAPGPHEAWPQLAKTLRSGTPDEAIAAALDRLYPDLVRATAATQRAVAAGVARELARRGTWSTPCRLVDLGCGSGVWLDELLDAAGPDSTAVAVDRGAVLDEARRTLRGRAVHFVDGDYLDAAIPEEPSRIAVLAHVLRAEPAERAEQLVRRAVGLLGPGGVLVVADYFRPDHGAATEQYRAARHDLTLAMTMRASTGGRGITETRLAEWAGAAGARPAAVLEPIPRQRVHLFTTEGAPR
jgi:ubiquinone/menaquinone biosynthesis C-methylase UbiE